MSRRKARQAQFLSQKKGAFVSLSSDLLLCALSELKQALDDRRRPVVRMSRNHYSPHALGSIVLLVAGLEAWLNETILSYGFTDKQFKSLAFDSVKNKYYEIPKRVTKTMITRHHDLELVINLRNEIAHYLPRIILEEGNVPSWFLGLQRRGLFIKPSHGRVDFLLGQKLASYRLAYWAWRTIEKAVEDLLDALSSEGELGRWTANNFRHYRKVCPPNKLIDYDAKYKLEVD